MSIDEIIKEFEESKDYPSSDPASDEALDGAIDIMHKYKKIQEILKYNEKTALRVYDEKFDNDICGNCLGYINRDYNYCPQCGARLEGNDK